MKTQKTHNMDVPQTLEEAIRYFSDPDRCLQFMVNWRWPDGVTCPVCGHKRVSFISTVRVWACLLCKKRFSIKVGTIMEDSPLPLSKWLTGMWLVGNAKNGISSYEIHRALGITQKSAWFMLHRIRHIMETGSLEKMKGECEADETFIGGEAKNMHKHKREAKIKGRGPVGKAIVMGILNRGERKTKEQKRKKEGNHSTVHAAVVANTQKETLQPEVRKIVEPGSLLCTDELQSYEGMEEYVHEMVNHSQEYVRGNIHTNGMENFWSLFKRCIKGTYVSVEPDHLNRYVAEEVFRFNERELKDGDRLTKIVARVAGKRLTYKQLIGATETV